MTKPRVAVVVGGASGIGAMVASRHREAGDRVAVWDVAGEFDIACDVSDPEQIDEAVNRTIDEMGPPDVVTITAGIGHSASLHDARVSEWDVVMSVNARGPWLVMRSLATRMSDGNGGSIVAVSSVSSRLPDATMGIYCASKAALNMVVKVAAKEWAPTVRVNAIAPGVTDTAMLGSARRDGAWLTGVAHRTPLGRLGHAQDIADAILGIHDMTWVTGQILECDGGLALHSPIVP